MLYPNPSDGNIRIEGVEVVEFQVFNSLGQLVKTYHGVNEVCVADLTKGIYLLRIINNKGEISTRKIIVK